MGIPGGIASSLGKFGFIGNAWGLSLRGAGPFSQELIVPSTAEQGDWCSRAQFQSSSTIRINFQLKPNKQPDSLEPLTQAKHIK